MEKTKTLFGNFPKTKDHEDNFSQGKDVYLLGVDAEGTKYWLQAPTWDCGWYWGFGYIETYEGNRKPSNARDIDSHQHAERFYPEWVHGDKARLTATTFNEREAWELAELFKQFYLFQKLAELYHGGTAGVTRARITHKDEKEAKRINEEVIPKITAAILEILTP